MPAAAVASFTPAISGMAGTSVGASGETAVDMEGFRLEEGSALYHLRGRGGRGWLQASQKVSSLRTQGPITTSGGCWGKAGDQRARSGAAACGSRLSARFARLAGTTSTFLPRHFFAGAILESDGFGASLAASGFASGLAAASAGLSMRSTLAASRSL